MKNRFLVYAASIFLALGIDGAGADLPDGVSMKEAVPISNPAMTQSNKDYYREGVKFFSDVTLTVPGAPNDVRSYRSHHDGVTILTVGVRDKDTHFSGDKDYRIWVWTDSVTIFCLDDDYYVFVQFDESGDPVFHSTEEQAASRETYIANKAKYELRKEP